ncbi:MAG: enoyl-CoA hydratase-related protein [Acidimicrobiaceae bacterium]|nr:enoyl-CoA hydratase-related protein [Acidimicrobiaceae bacterium]
MSDSYENLSIDAPADGVTRITFNRPERLNAITHGLVSELHDALSAVDNDHDTRAIVLTGAGRGFCAGLDLTGYGTVPGTEDHGDPQRGMAVQQGIAELVHHMRDVRQPIIAAINGAAAGGGFAIACASDVRYCAETAKFGTAFVRLGISGCDIGVSWMLPRLIGASRAWELLLTGRVFDAAEADRIGLVSAVAPDEDLMDTCLGVAAEIAANSPFGVWMTKEVMWSNLEIGSLRAGIDLENRTQIMSSLTEDSREAMASFLERRQVKWSNR